MIFYPKKCSTLTLFLFLLRVSKSFTYAAELNIAVSFINITGIKELPGSIALHLERLRIGETIWEVEHREKQWASFVFKFPGKMAVWHKYIEQHTASSLKVAHYFLYLIVTSLFFVFNNDVIIFCI